MFEKHEWIAVLVVVLLVFALSAGGWI